MNPARAYTFLAVPLVFGLLTLSPPPCVAGDYYLRGATPNTLDDGAPTGTTAKFKDSPAVNRTTYQEIGVWWAAPLGSAMQLNSLSDLRVWIGLKNSDDQGTYFDIRAELRTSGALIASGETKNIQGVTRNPSLAKEVAVAFGAISSSQFAAGDRLSIHILTKVADSGGHNNAVGLRMYYDAASRPSKFEAMFGSSAPTITIVSPASDSTISDYTVRVTGTFNTSLGEVGINVNGYVALQDGAEFATFVPLDNQTTSLNATVTNTSGTTLGSHTIPITAHPPTTEPVLSFRPFPAIALESQPVGFTLTGLNEISQIQLDGNGDGTIDFTGTTLDGVSVTFEAPGIYFPTVTVTDTSNAVLADSAIVHVVDINQLDAQLRAKWNGMKNALRGGDTAGAAGYIVSNKRTSYETVFNNLTISFSAIDQMLGSITYQAVKGLEIEYEMLMNDGPDGDVSYLVLFSLDADGLWRISFF